MSKQKLRARMKETAVHRLHKNESYHLAVIVPVAPAYLAVAPFTARWALSTVCKVQPKLSSAVHGVTA